MSALDFAARHTMDSDSWYSPKPFVEAARETMGGLDLDPASHGEANRIVQADRFLSEAENGLTREWWGRVFLNPPGGLVNEFWQKLTLELFYGRINQAIWIGYSLEQLQTLQHAGTPTTPSDYPECIPRRRIAFVKNEAKKAARIAKLLEKAEAPAASKRARDIAAAIRRGQPPKDAPSHRNYITYIGPRVEDFERVFSQFGKVRR